MIFRLFQGMLVPGGYSVPNFLQKCFLVPSVTLPGTCFSFVNLANQDKEEPVRNWWNKDAPFKKWRNMTRSQRKINSFLSTKNQTNQFILICKSSTKSMQPTQPKQLTHKFWHFELDAIAGLCQLYGYIHPTGYEALFQTFPFSRFSFFKAFLFYVFLFQGFPFLCFPFSRGCPCCLDDSCSRALFQELLIALFSKSHHCR